MTQKKIMGDAICCVSIIVPFIGLGFAVYNYYVFDKPFMTTTSKRVTSCIFPVCDNVPSMPIQNQIRSKDKKEV